MSPISTYLITGGLGGLGLQIAQWLSNCGAKYLVLFGRSFPTARSKEVVNHLKESGVQVLVLQVDVAHPEKMAQAIAQVKDQCPPLKGIIHAAGLLDDGMLPQQTWQRFTTVMTPKVRGAWNLHTLTQDLDLDFFVLFSSVVSVLGAPSQGNYAAANAFLDGLAHYRRQKGLSALSLNWGPWSEAGMAAALGTAGEQQWSRQGISMLTPAQGIESLERLMQSTATQVSVLRINWNRYAALLNTSNTALISELVSEKPLPDSVSTQLQGSALLRQQLETISSVSEGRAYLMAFVQAQVAYVLRLPASRPPQTQQSLFEMGFDSLLSLELRNILAKELGESLPATLVFNYPTISELVNFIAEEVLGLQRPETDSVESTEVNSSVDDSLDHLTTHEMATLLSDRLATINLDE